MTNEHTYCVIMAGGVGSRFWPMSRSAYPKQFLDFLGLGRTLLQQTYDRFLTICPPENILVVTNANYAGIVQEQLPALKASQILAEPSRRNTAPCVAYANHVIANVDAISAPELRMNRSPLRPVITSMPYPPEPFAGFSAKLSRSASSRSMLRSKLSRAI